MDRQEYEGGLKVIFLIEEKPVIDKITFSKLQYFAPKVILRKLKTQEGKFLDNKSLKDDENMIGDLTPKRG